MAIARVQSVSQTTGAPSNATSLVLTFAAPTTAGNTVMVGIATSVITLLKVTSSHGTFAQVFPATDVTGANEYVYLFKGDMTGADTAITIAGVAGGTIGNLAAVAVEYSGAGLIADATPATVGASGINAANTGNVANANVNALYVGVIGVKTQSGTNNSSWATNNITPFNIASQNTTSNNTTTTIDRAIVYLDAIVSTSSTRGTNVNHGFGTNRYAGLLMTFAQSAAAATAGGLRIAGHGGLAA